MTVPLVASFAAALVLSLALAPAFGRVARRLNFMDLPGPRKIHDAPVPYGGGLAVAAAVFAGTGTAHFLALAAVGGPLHAPQPGDFLPPSRATWLYGLGAFLILILGLVDDRVKLSAGIKLAVQTLAALGVSLGGERFQLFALGPAVEVAATVFWILAVTNAFNLLDHMDGLSGGVAAVAGGAFLIVALQTGQWGVAVLLAPLLGACLGFLPYNFPPARLFLGDAGSLFIGFWLSCLTISFTFYERAHYPLYTYFVPLAVLAVPIFDTACVVAIRLLRRRPIFQGDTNHLAHRLTGLGMSRRLAVLTVYALTAVTGISAVLLYHVSTTGAVLLLVQLLLTFGIMTLLEAAGRSQGSRP
jgi:UDP-GlcNAc:undecaprenyl-phosphate GlcNAc-1-phosphate transferase